MMGQIYVSSTDTRVVPTGIVLAAYVMCFHDNLLIQIEVFQYVLLISECCPMIQMQNCSGVPGMMPATVGVQ